MYKLFKLNVALLSLSLIISQTTLATDRLPNLESATGEVYAYGMKYAGNKTHVIINGKAADLIYDRIQTPEVERPDLVDQGRYLTKSSDESFVCSRTILFEIKDQRKAGVETRCSFEITPQGKVISE